MKINRSVWLVLEKRVKNVENIQIFLQVVIKTTFSTELPTFSRNVKIFWMCAPIGRKESWYSSIFFNSCRKFILHIVDEAFSLRPTLSVRKLEHNFLKSLKIHNWKFYGQMKEIYDETIEIVSSQLELHIIVL